MLKFEPKKIGLFVGVLTFILILLLEPLGNTLANSMGAVASLMAILWIMESIPIAVTSLIPLVLFPILEIANPSDVSNIYINKTIFLFLGGFLIAKAIEKNHLHKRLSLSVIKLFGGSTNSILIGFIISCWLMSMFITNTATTIIMLPIGLSVIYALEDKFEKHHIRNFAIALMLGIAYSSTLGGISTLVGTVPNLVFKGIYETSFPNSEEITFASWMSFGFPLSLLMVIVLILVFKILFKIPQNLKFESNFINNELKKLGKINRSEKLVLLIVFTTTFLWIFRQNINLGFIELNGWSNLLPKSIAIHDSTIAISMSLLLFIIPNEDGEKLLTNNEIKSLPWDILLLFGGGFALAKGFQISGLSELIGSYFSFLGGINPYVISFLVSLVIIFLTELTSNTATVNTFLPILASISVTLNIDPLILMIPATIAASFAFMLPVATPPNAIIFSSGKLEIRDMMKAGLWLNLISAVLIPLAFYFFGSRVFEIN
ncbi:SLC13 family permease [Candidatus Kapabacteria bacterium]|nr:SLC13 family permease [Candidatus Kapabacteria bacterium]